MNNKEIASKNNKKLMQEVIVLVLVVVAIGGFSILKFGAPASTPTATVVPIDTTFDESAIKQLGDKDTVYPDVSPSPGELGKSDPFAP